MRREVLHVAARLMLVAAGAAWVAGCGSAQTVDPSPVSSADPALDFAEAKADLLAGDTEAAVAALKRSVRLGPSAEGFYYLALIEYQRGDVEFALKQVCHSIKWRPTAEAFLLKGALLEPSDPAAAAECYRLGLGRSPKSDVAALLHRNLGMALAKENAWGEAFGHFRLYVAHAGAKGKPMDDAELAFWGLLLYRAGDEEGAGTVWATIHDGRLREAVSEAAEAVAAARPGALVGMR